MLLPMFTFNYKFIQTVISGIFRWAQIFFFFLDNYDEPNLKFKKVVSQLL